MAKKTTLGRMYIDQLKADRAAQRVNIEMPTGLRKAIEEKLGRKLTDAEAIRGEVDRVDKRPPAERFADEHFVVKLKANTPKTGAELLLEDAMNAARDEYLASLPRAQFRVEIAKELVAKEQAGAIAAKAHEDFLKNHAETIQKLDNLRTDLLFEDSWSFAEARDVDRALQAFATPGADEQFCLECANKVFGVQQQKIATAAQALIAKRLELEGQIAELQEQMPVDDPAPAPEAKGFDYDAHLARMEKLAAVADSFAKLSATAIHGDAEGEV